MAWVFFWKRMTSSFVQCDVVSVIVEEFRFLQHRKNCVLLYEDPRFLHVLVRVWTLGDKSLNFVFPI
jgi:hypothetical protein